MLQKRNLDIRLGVHKVIFVLNKVVERKLAPGKCRRTLPTLQIHSDGSFELSFFVASCFRNYIYCLFYIILELQAELFHLITTAAYLSRELFALAVLLLQVFEHLIQRLLSVPHE